MVMSSFLCFVNPRKELPSCTAIGYILQESSGGCLDFMKRKEQPMGVSAYGMVLLADGSLKRAEDLQIGDLIRNALSGHPVAVRQVWQDPGVGMIRLTADNGELLDVTEDTVFLVETGLASVDRIPPGTPLRTDAGTARCTDASAMMGDYMVYDIVLDGADAVFIIVKGFVIQARNKS